MDASLMKTDKRQELVPFNQSSCLKPLTNVSKANVTCGLPVDG